MENNYFNNNDNNTNKEYNYPQPSTSYSYSSNDVIDVKPKKKKIFLKTFAFLTTMALVGAGSIQIYKYTQDKTPIIQDLNGSSITTETTTNANKNDEDSFKSIATKADSENIPSLFELASRSDAKSIPDIVDAALPSVVGVSATFEYTSQSYGGFNYWGYGGGGGSSTQEMKGTGTGIVMTEDGYIITNAHVVYDTSEYNCGEAIEVSVVMYDETEYNAKIIAYDVETDIAVLKVNQNNLVAAEFGDSNDLKVGELVIAIGNPLGFDLFGSVTSGIVSALNRQITINEKPMNLIQTDAAINSGNSGGPLLNSSGQVIGINSAKMSSSYSSSASIEGLGFAIPITEAKVIIDDLIQYGYVTGRPQIGISTQNVTDTISNFYGIPIGVYVTAVSEGSSAEWAGIKTGDVIIGIQDQSITTLEELNEIKNQYKAGDEITLTITRSGEDIEITLILQEVTKND